MDDVVVRGFILIPMMLVFPHDMLVAYLFFVNLHATWTHCNFGRRAHQVTVRHRRRVALFVQCKHQRDPLSGQVCSADAVGRLRGTSVELRVRHGSADLLTSATDR